MIDMNWTFLQITGHKRRGMIGMPLFKLLAADTAKRSINSIQTGLRNNEAFYRASGWFVGRDGKLIEYRGIVVFIRPLGKTVPTHFLGVCEPC